MCDELALGLVDAPQQEVQARRAGCRRRSVVNRSPLRLGDRGGAIEVREGLVGGAPHPRQPAERHLRDRLGPSVAELAAASRPPPAAPPPPCRRRGRELHARRRTRGERHRRGILVAALGEQPHALAEPGDDLLARALPHLAPQREEPGDRAGVRRDRLSCCFSSSSSIHTPHLGEEARDPPVDEQAPREVAGVVEPVRVDEVAHRGAQIRQLEPELRDRLRLPAAAAGPGAMRCTSARVVVGVRAPAPASASPRSSSRPSAYSRTIARSENTGARRPRSASRASRRRARRGRRSPVRPTSARAERLDRVEREPRREHAEVLEQVALRCRAAGSRSSRSSRASCGDAREGRAPLPSAAAGCCSSRSAMPAGRQHAHLRGGELDRERQALEPPADVREIAAAFSSVSVEARLRPPAPGRRTARTPPSGARGPGSPGRRRPASSAAAPRRPARRGCAARCGS